MGSMHMTEDTKLRCEQCRLAVTKMEARECVGLIRYKVQKLG